MTRSRIWAVVLIVSFLVVVAVTAAVAMGDGPNTPLEQGVAEKTPVTKDVRGVNALLTALLASVVSLVGGYYFGLVRSRSEQRDGAIAEIFKEMMLFYRGTLGWIDDPNPNGSPDVEPDTPWKYYCWKRLSKFMDVFHGYEIWLDKETYKLMQEFAHAGIEILEKFSRPRAVNESHEERRAEWDPLRRDVLAPKLNELSDTLRAEMEWPRSLIPRMLLPSSISNKRPTPSKTSEAAQLGTEPRRS